MALKPLFNEMLKRVLVSKNIYIDKTLYAIEPKRREKILKNNVKITTLMPHIPFQSFVQMPDEQFDSFVSEYYTIEFLLRSGASAAKLTEMRPADIETKSTFIGKMRYYWDKGDLKSRGDNEVLENPEFRQMISALT